MFAPYLFAYGMFDSAFSDKHGLHRRARDQADAADRESAVEWLREKRERDRVSGLGSKPWAIRALRAASYGRFRTIEELLHAAGIRRTGYLPIRVVLHKIGALGLKVAPSDLKPHLKSATTADGDVELDLLPKALAWHAVTEMVGTCVNTCICIVRLVALWNCNAALWPGRSEFLPRRR